MNLKEFIDLLFTVFGAIGSIYVLRSITRITPEVTEEISATKLGHNPDHIDSISEQKADGLVGNILIIMALIIAITNSALDFSKIQVFTNRIYAIVFVILISIIVYLIIIWIGKKIDKKHRRKVAIIIISDQIDRMMEREIIQGSDVRSLEFMSERYLCLRSNDFETKMDYVVAISKLVEKKFPDNIKFEE